MTAGLVRGSSLLLGLAAAWFIQTRTTLGRNFYAVGGGEDLAHASGVNVAWVRVLGYALAGFFYAVAAILMVGRIGQAESVTGSGFMAAALGFLVGWILAGLLAAPFRRREQPSWR